MKTKNFKRNQNILSCNDLDGKKSFINLERVDYWKADGNDTEVHIFNCNFSFWLAIDGDDFEKEYLKWKKENG